MGRRALRSESSMISTSNGRDIFTTASMARAIDGTVELRLMMPISAGNVCGEICQESRP
jgi:hypothetical protein